MGSPSGSTSSAAVKPVVAVVETGLSRFRLVHGVVVEQTGHESLLLLHVLVDDLLLGAGHGLLALGVQVLGLPLLPLLNQLRKMGVLYE